MQIQLEDNVAAALTDRARACGQSLEEFLIALSAEHPLSAGRRQTGDEAVRLIEAEAGSVHATYQGSYSREDIYCDHD